MSDLKPCPFCGGEVNVMYRSDMRAFVFWHTKRSERCPLFNPIELKVDMVRSLKEAREIWNKAMPEKSRLLCTTCKYKDKAWDEEPCDGCCKGHSGYEGAE